jgi:hypothetical protein
MNAEEQAGFRISANKLKATLHNLNT